MSSNERDRPQAPSPLEPQDLPAPDGADANVKGGGTVATSPAPGDGSVRTIAGVSKTSSLK